MWSDIGGQILQCPQRQSCRSGLMSCLWRRRYQYERRQRWCNCAQTVRLTDGQRFVLIRLQGSLPMLIEQSFIKEKIARLFVEVVKREWPGTWDDMDQFLRQLYFKDVGICLSAPYISLLKYKHRTLTMLCACYRRQRERCLCSSYVRCAKMYVFMMTLWRGFGKKI